MQGEEEFFRLGLFKFALMTFSASELLLLSEKSSSTKPQPASPLVILLLLSFLSEADEWLRLPKPPCAGHRMGTFTGSGYQGGVRRVHCTHLCTHSSVVHTLSRLLVQGLLERWALHRVGHR